LPHEYNILEKAGSSLGKNHSEETRQKISDAILQLLIILLAKQQEPAQLRFRAGPNI
jgi:hypothetical protein